MLKKSLLASLVAAALGVSAIPASAVVITVGPPAPRYEAVPVARAGYVWTPGYWNWQRNQHVWVAGRYVRERPGYVYSAPTWVQRDGNWNLNHGAYVRGDRDHDGVPNRVDARPDNPRRN